MSAPTSGLTQTTSGETTQVMLHSGRRQSRNKKQDPFLDLPDDLDVLKQLATSTPSPSENGNLGSPPSLLADVRTRVL